jgi:hypothetical protein
MKMMNKPDKNGRLAGWLMVLACYVGFVSLFITAVAYAFGTDPLHFLQLQS